MAVVPALPALRDLATLDDGRTCVVVERLAGPTLAALATGRVLTAGEAVTVLAPIALAMTDLERAGFAHVRLALSDVMFDESGRPRIIGTGALVRLDGGADDPGARTARLREMTSAYARLVTEVSAVTRPATALDPVRRLIDEVLAVRPFRAHSDEIEHALFGVAVPAPVDLGARAPSPSRRHRADTEADRAGSAASVLGTVGSIGRVTPAQEPRRLPRMTAPFDALLHEALPTDASVEDAGAEPFQPAGSNRLLAGGRERIAQLRRALRGRRPVMIVAALIGGAALVLALTLVPPTAGTAERAAATAPPPVQSGAAADAGELATSTPPTNDAAAAVRDLLHRRHRCYASADVSCLREVLQVGSALEAADHAALASAQTAGDTPETPPFALDAARVSGGMGEAWLVEVPYVDPERPPASVLVMRSEAGWRLREIFG